jgi:hypothetical protein
VLESSARLVAASGMRRMAPGGGGASRRPKQRPLDELVTGASRRCSARATSATSMANVPRAALDAVKQVLPGSTARR